MLSLRSNQKVGKAIAVMTGALWASNFFVATVAAGIRGDDEPAMRAVVRLGADLGGIGLCLVMLAILERCADRSLRHRAAWAVPLAFAAAAITLAVNFLAIRWTGLGSPLHRENLGTQAYFLGIWFWFYLGWAALYLAIFYSAQTREEAALRAQSQNALRTAQLQALRFQINPHFLFNAFNSLSSLVIDQRTSEAETMIDRMTEFMRFSLAEGLEGDVPLCDELRHQRLYLDIERIRFPELRLHLDIEPGLERSMVPALLLQPLVENAVIHSPGGGLPKTIRLSARRVGRRLHLELTNLSSTRPASAGHGIGLANVRSRLAARYGDRFELTANPTPAGVFRVAIEIPVTAP